MTMSVPSPSPMSNAQNAMPAPQVLSIAVVRPPIARDTQQPAQVGKLHRHRPGRFQPDQLRGRSDGSRQRRGVERVVEAMADAPGGQLVLRKHLRRAVHVGGQQHFVAGPQQRNVHHHDGRQAARRQQRVAAAFERGDALLERERRRRAMQPVGVARLALPFARTQRGGVAEQHRRRLVDADRYRVDLGCAVGVMDEARRQRLVVVFHSTSPTRSWPSVATMRARTNSPTFKVRDAFAGGNSADAAVDLGRVGVAAADAALAAERRRVVDQHLHRRAEPALEPAGRDSLGRLHEAGAPFVAHVRRQHAGQRVCRGTVHRRIGEAAGAVDLGFLDELQQMLELGFGLAGKAGDEGAAHDELRASRAPRCDALQVALAAGRPLHAPQHVGVRMLERHVEVRQHAPRRHQRQQLVDVRIRIDVVQSHPRAVRLGQPAQCVDQVEHPRLQRLAVPEAGAVANVDAVGTGVLADDQQLLHAGIEQALRFGQHVADRPRHQVAAHRRNDAERAAVVAAFADLQVRVVARRQLDALCRDQIGERVVRLRHMAVHRIHHLVRRVRAGDGKHVGVRLAHHVALRAQAAGDDHLAVGSQRIADRVEAFLHCVVDETAGVDDDEIGPVVGLGSGVALRGELREDQLGIGQGLRTTE